MEKSDKKYLLTTPFGSRLDNTENIVKLVNFIDTYQVIPKDMFFEYKNDKEVKIAVDQSAGLIKVFYDAKKPLAEITAKDSTLMSDIVLKTEGKSQMNFVCELLKKVNAPPEFINKCKKG